VNREKRILEFWKEHDIFGKSRAKNEGREPYTFYDGPPTANGKPHIGHALTRSIKDIIPRYRTMKGYHTERKAGWDTHGLPVELEVEKELGFTDKSDIEKYGVEAFIEKCKASVWKYKEDWERMSQRIGFWVDYDNPYITYEDNFIESVWWALKEIDKKGLLYKGHKVLPFCGRCGTPLSSHEVAQGYKDVTEDSVYVKIKAANELNTYFLVWTTTPWTLPSNVALCANPKAIYVRWEMADGSRYILAKDLVAKIFPESDGKIVEEFTGESLKGKKYEPLFDFVGEKDKQNAFFVVTDNYVTTADGTGFVHIAPAFGEDDNRVGKLNNLPFVQFVDECGKFTAEVKGYAGKSAISSNPELIVQLKQEGKLFKKQKYTHNYPHCWRCHTPLIYYAKKSWFIKMTAIKNDLVANNRSVNWLPENFKEGRMGTFLENVIDWGISRDRYWGTPLPVWECACGHYVTIGSKDELLKRAGKLPKELHKPFIDEILFNCDKCGGQMKRTPEVIDCWADSGAMTFAQHHYPFENHDKFAREFPADFISEGSDQSRGWFYTLQAFGTALFGKSPYKTCIALGLVNDKDGKKMSKHLGNVVNPWDMFDKQGADAVRWYFYQGSSPWISSRFYEEAVDESKRKFMGTLWNVYSFFVTYANIEKFDPSLHSLSTVELELLDKWILSKLFTLAKNVDSNLFNYKIYESAKEITAFTDILSNWYVRRSRERFWGSKGGKSSASALFVLHFVLKEFTKIIAPFVPFIAEEIYLNLTSNSKDEKESVHLTDFPKADERYIDKKLEEDMETVYNTVVAGRAARNSQNIKNRQPLSKLYVALPREDFKFTSDLKQIVLDELNIDEIIISGKEHNFVSYELKPQLKTLGAKFGAGVNKIREFLAEETDGKLIEQLKQGAKQLTYQGFNFELGINDVLIRTISKEGFCSATENGITVFIDTTLTAELITRGNARELVSKIQNFRKEAGLQVEDRVELFITSPDNKLNVEELFALIKADVLATSITNANGGQHKTEVDINDMKVAIGITKVKK
jgi:isoleucyl-tRNA synthetase